MNKEIKKRIRFLMRFFLNYYNRKRLKNKNFSVISQNCIGGVILHDLGQRFNSPTVNLMFSASDYIKFCSNLRSYLAEELKPVKTDKDYPCAMCGDIIIYFVHYKTFEEAKTKWEERIKRINFDNLFFIMADRDECTQKERMAFDNLPYKHKAFITYKERPEIKSSVVIKNAKDEEYNQVIDTTQYLSMFTGRRYIDDWDYVSFFNC